MKKVSIIVPVYNVYDYIDKCLNSLVSQTLDDIEIIVVNDGSPDNSQEIIDKYVKAYPDKIKSFVKENGGQGSARNFGYKKATGEYIGYVDSDDYIDIHMYEKLYKRAKKDNSDIVMCANCIVYENGNKKIENLFLKTDDDKVNALFNNPGVCNKIYKRELLKDLSFRSKVWYEDIDFVSKVVIKAQKISFIDEGLYYYLLRSGSTMNNNNMEKNLEILDAFDSLILYLKKEKIYDKYIQEVTFLAIFHIYISAVVRVINMKKNIKKKEIINKLILYMDNNFNGYKKNKYLYLLDRNKKIIYNLITCKCYFFVRVIFKIKDILR